MSPPGKFSQFWQELKRRKVLNNAAVYAATAFIIMEAADIMLPRLGLPDWTVTLIIILLISGLPVSIILSWIYDFTPEGIRKTESRKNISYQKETPQPVRRRLKWTDIIIVLLFAAVCALLYPRIFHRDKFESIREQDGRISIAIMPYENLTGDSSLNYLQKGISSLIINGLGGSDELSVRDDHTMHEVLSDLKQLNTASIAPSMRKEAARMVKAEAYISGSYQGYDDQYIILTNLIETESGDVIWSHKLEGNLTSSEYLELGNNLCNDIRDHLEIKALKEGVDFDFREAYTESAQAYRYYIEGMDYILSLEYELAIELMKKALEVDSTFTYAAFYIAWAYCYGQTFEGIEYWTAKAHGMRENLPADFRYLVELWYAAVNLKEGGQVLRYCELLAKSDSRSRLFWLDLGVTYHGILLEYEKAVDAFAKIEEINRERGREWDYFSFFQGYIRALNSAGYYEKEKEVSDRGLKLFPDNVWLIRRRYALALVMENFSEVEEYSIRLNKLAAEQGWTEAYLEYLLSIIYREGNNNKEAEIHARKSHTLEPYSAANTSMLAHILIIENLDPEEGLDIIQELIVEEPEDANYQFLAGVACKKLGKLKEAKEYLAKATQWSTIYSREVESELEEVTRLLASNSAN